MHRRDTGAWLLRFVKGMLIGTGFILPGVSGGALAAVFGMYERLVAFLAHLTRDFRSQFLYFLPVGLGGACGVFLLSFAVSFFLEAYEAQILWFFVGCIGGTLPALWRQAGRRGRRPRHLAILLLTALGSYVLLRAGQSSLTHALPQAPLTWLFAGALIGLGTVIPGLSPSNFLVYFGLYKAMTDGIKMLDPGVILPLTAGAAACVLLLSKVMDRAFARGYASLFHAMIGVVVASTCMIVPGQYSGVHWLRCLPFAAAGALLGYGMTRLEERHKPAHSA